MKKFIMLLLLQSLIQQVSAVVPLDSASVDQATAQLKVTAGNTTLTKTDALLNQVAPTLVATIAATGLNSETAVADYAAIRTALNIPSGTSAVATVQALGGGADPIDASLLTSPTGNATTDLATARALFVTSLGATLQVDAQTLNLLLNGAATSSTVQARIGAPGGTLTSLFAMIGVTGAANIAAALGNTGTGNSSIGALLGGGAGIALYNAIVGSTGILYQIDGTPGDDGSSISSRLSPQIQAIEGSATQLSTAIGDVNTILGGTNPDLYSNLVALNTILGLTGTAYSRIGSLGSASSIVAMLGVTSPSSIAAALGNTGAGNSSISALLGGSGSTALYAVIVGSGGILSQLDGTITDSGNVSGKLTAQTQAIQGSATQLSSAISAANSALGGTGTILARIGAPTVNSSGSNLATVIGGSGADIATRLGDPGPNFVSLSAMIGGTSTTIVTQLGNVLGTNSIIANIGGSTASVQAALNALSVILVNNSTFGSSLYTQATTLSTNLDSGLSSLPNVGTYATVAATPASDGSGGVNITISSGLGSANGTYNLSSSTIGGAIANGATFTLINGSYNLVLVNKSGATINSQLGALRYLISMYPVSSQIATGISDKITNGLNKQLGGSATSTRSRIAAIDVMLLASPTGVVATDLTTLEGLIVGTPTGVLQTDIQTVNSSLNGTAAGSTVAARIGAPSVNSASSNLAAVMGGSGDLATRLGDPVVGSSSTGISALIGANDASSPVWDISAFTGATTIHDQLSAFLGLFTGPVTVNCGVTPPASLGALLALVTGPDRLS